MHSLDRVWGVFDDYFYGVPIGSTRRPYQHLNYKREVGKEEIKLEFDLPGVKREKIEIEGEDGELLVTWVRGGKKESYRLVNLEEYVLEETEAKLEDGVLYISIPRVKEEEKESKWKVEIK